MKTEFITYDTLPLELAEIKNKAFAHSKFTSKCEKMDKLGSYTAMYMDGKFIGALNTITNHKPIELWSDNFIEIENSYTFFCRGFIGEGIKRGYGSYILLLLSMKVIENKSSVLFYTSCRKQHKTVINQLKNCGYKLVQDFDSFHQGSPIELSLFKYSTTKNQAKENITQLITYLKTNLNQKL